MGELDAHKGRSDELTTAPLVTIVITTKDRLDLARRAVASALDQTLSDIEVIVVDDGSEPPFSDASEDPRLRIMRSPTPTGVNRARNIGLEAATGGWITFLDDDDWLAPQMVQASLAAAEVSPLPPPVAVLSGMRVVDGTEALIHIRLPHSSPKGRAYFLSDNGSEVRRGPADVDGESPVVRSYKSHNTLLAPVQLVRGIGGWDERILAFMHDDFFLRLNSVCSIQGIDEVTYTKINHQGVRRSGALLDRAAGMERTVQKHRDAFRSQPRRYAHYLARISYLYLVGGKWWRAIAASSRSVAARPSEPRLIRHWLAALLGPRLFGKVRPLFKGSSFGDEIASG